MGSDKAIASSVLGFDDCLRGPVITYRLARATMQRVRAASVTTWPGQSF